MHITLTTYLIVCPLVMLGGLIDSIAGGGGLISLPAYYLAGLPMHFALGTNKLSSSIGTFTSTIRFIKSGRVHLLSACVAAAGALAGSWVGARMALLLNDKYLKYIMLVLLPAVAVFVLLNRNFGRENRARDFSNTVLCLLSAVSGLCIGCYDGFFGPGTGSFLILAFTCLMKFDLTTSSGNAKVVNLASNIAAVFTFLLSGSVVILLGIPAAIFGVLGNWIGSGLAIKNGGKVIRPVFIVTLALIVGTVTYDLITNG